MWIEYFANGALADEYEEYLSDLSRVVLPPIVVAEVRRWLNREQVDPTIIDQALAAMMATHLMTMDVGDAVLTAGVIERVGLAMADAVIYAHALAADAVLVTQDAHFAGLMGVKVHPHPNQVAAPDLDSQKRRGRRRPPS